jgi:uncharacterized protein YprB with RNaseH-like and TPR domain
MANKPYQHSTELFIGIPKGSLLDFETTGIEPYQSEIITFGFVTEAKLRVIQRTDETEKEFINCISSELKALSQPFYAYNSDFEKKYINYKFNFRPEFVDLMEPWRKKATNSKIKWPKLGELITEPEEYFGEKIIDGKACPTIWECYRKTKDRKYLDLIMRHNQIDLLRELVLLIHYPIEQPKPAKLRLLDF